MIDAREMCQGLVQELEPPRLLEDGNTEVTCVEERRTRCARQRFFIAAIKGAWCACAPLFTKKGVGSALIPQSARHGSPDWRNLTVYYHPAQLWLVSIDVAVEAASKDRTTPGSRNYVLIKSLNDDHVLGWRHEFDQYVKRQLLDEDVLQGASTS